MSEILSRKQIDRDYYWNEGYAAGLAAADERVRELVGALELCREYIWLNHGCSIGCLYGDDGERQCNNWTQHRPLDFKRQPISEILSELRAAALRKLGKE